MDGTNDTHDTSTTPHYDERTPLLEVAASGGNDITLGQNKQPKRTPLPKLQIGIVLLLQICEPICSQSIYPYINELVGTLDIIGGDERRIGYYAGLIESLFFATEAITVFQWSRTSDMIGRKPVLMIGMIGTIISMLCFGLSRTFTTLVISRCLCGLLNGNIGVIKSTMGELTDNTNRADAFALMPAVWALGATMGPLLGGTLTRPADHFPTVFTSPFWKEYPYFLPCVATASAVLAVFVITGIWFEETAPVFHEKPTKTRDSSVSTSSTLTETQSRYSNAQVSLRGLLVFPVIISIANYMSLAFLNISTNALLPLFFHMPINMGGLDLDPVTIGYVMGIYGFGTGMFQVAFFAKIVRRWGIRRVFIMSMATFIPVFMMFPFISLLAKSYGVFWGVWIMVFTMLVILFFMDTAYGCIFMYVTESAPNRRSLGATNGLAQTTVSTARAIGPALSTSLYSFSVEHQILGGYGVYAVLTTLAILALLLAIQLPHQLWNKEDSEREHSD